MSWLDELEYDYEYRCKQCGCEALFRYGPKDNPEPQLDCHSCKAESALLKMGMVPMKLGGVTKVEYEKNGVKAWRVQDSNGNVRHVSKMAENYYNTAKVQSQNTRAFNDKVVENTGREFRKFKKELDSQAKVTSARKGDE